MLPLYYKIHIFILMLLFATSCSNGRQNKAEKPLAKVFNKLLYPSDIKGIVGKGVSPRDSAVIVRNHVDNWAMEQLIMSIAEQNISKDIDIDGLVESYRKSLIRHSYEQALIEQRLDSVISLDEIQRYYEQSKKQYQLDKNIVRCHFIKIPATAPEQDKVKKWWTQKEESDYQYLMDYSRRYADKFILNDSTWVNTIDLVSELPSGVLTEDALGSKVVKVLEREDYVYFIRIKERISKGNTAPLSYVRSKIETVILRKRKLELLENLTEELYQRELNKKNVKIYIQ